MTTTPGFLSGSIATQQNLYTITYPNIDTHAITIANVSKATTCVVTTNSKLPPAFVDGTAIVITGVGGMTQLKTSGINSSSKYYANVITANTLGLYTNQALTANVNSTGFTNATANTGQFNSFTVPQFNDVTSPATVAFNTLGTSAGTDISLATSTGVITLATTKSYLLSATLNTTRTVPVTSTAGYQWFNVTANAAIGPFVKFGETCTTTITTSVSTQVALKVYSNESTFEYPNQVSGSFTAEVIGGYTV